MADKVDAITSDVLNKRDDSGDQMVTVKALKSFHRNEDMRGEVVGPESDAFDVPRSPRGPSFAPTV